MLLEWAKALLRARAETIVDVLETGLRHASEAVGARGAIVFQMASDGSYVEAVYQWRAPGLVSMREARYYALEIPETFAAFQRGDNVVVRTDDPTAGHPTLRAVMEEQRSTGTMALPMQDGGVTSWILVFEWRDSPPTFNPEVIAFGERAASLLHAGLSHERELTSNAEAQGKLLERQKIETLGVMAGGIVGLSEVLKAQLPPGSSQEHLASLIGSAATRAADLTHRFLVFSRQGARQRQNLPVAETLNTTLKLLRRSIPENRRIRLTSDGPVGAVYMAPIDFEQAIVNLSGADRALLSKPYPAKQMLRCIRRLIDARAGAETSPSGGT